MFLNICRAAILVVLQVVSKKWAEKTQGYILLIALYCSLITVTVVMNAYGCIVWLTAQRTLQQAVNAAVTDETVDRNCSEPGLAIMLNNWNHKICY